MSKSKLNFAKRVTVRLTPKHDSDGAVSQKRIEVLAETNKHQLKIDRSCFTKTDQEKEELRIEKAHWKKLQSV